MCFKAAFRRQPRLRGRLKVSFTITSNGSVSNVRDVSVSGIKKARDLKKCLSGAAAKIRFPSFKGVGKVKVVRQIRVKNQFVDGCPCIRWSR